jgi:ABC-2 type transport system ATP-binding protein
MSGAPAQPAIATFCLTKYYGHNRGIDDLSIAVAPGEIFGFLGPNGAGKSTTIRALMGLQHPTRGSAAILGLDTWHHSVEVHRHVGYLPGELTLFDRMTGRQHVDWFARVRGLDVARDVARLVDRLDVVLDRPVKELSKGNRQKLGIVLATMHRPEVLVLDEPSSGLDPLVQDAFHGLVREMAAEGTTVFLSSHELDEVQRVADRVAIIKDGRLVVTDSVENLRATAPQTVEVDLRLPVDPRRFESIEGVRCVRVEGARVTLQLVGPIAPLLRVVAELEPVDLVARKADLDELFLSYYRSDEVSDEVVDAS